MCCIYIRSHRHCLEVYFIGLWPHLLDILFLQLCIKFTNFYLMAGFVQLYPIHLLSSYWLISDSQNPPQTGTLWRCGASVNKPWGKMSFIRTRDCIIRNVNLSPVTQQRCGFLVILILGAAFLTYIFNIYLLVDQVCGRKRIIQAVGPCGAFGQDVQHPTTRGCQTPSGCEKCLLNAIQS